MATRQGTSRARAEPSFFGLELAVFYMTGLKVFEMSHIEAKSINIWRIYDQKYSLSIHLYSTSLNNQN